MKMGVRDTNALQLEAVQAGQAGQIGQAWQGDRVVVVPVYEREGAQGRQPVQVRERGQRDVAA